MLTLICLFTTEALAQNWQNGSGGRLYVNPTSTRVGVGTTNPYSSYQMTVIGASNKSGIYAKSSNSNGYAGYFSGHIGLTGDIKGRESYSTFNIYTNSSDSDGAYLSMYGRYSSSRPGGMTIAAYQQGTTEFYSRTTSGWNHHMTIHPK